MAALMRVRLDGLLWFNPLSTVLPEGSLQLMFTGPAVTKVTVQVSENAVPAAMEAPPPCMTTERITTVRDELCNNPLTWYPWWVG